MKSILVVDDAPDILEVVQFILTKEGYQVQTSLNGAYFQHMKGDLPDLILLDVLLLGEDGREICQRVKRTEQTKHIPVVLLSAHVAGKSAVEASGADDFLAKPFRLGELIDMVKKYLLSPD
jgi:CheY-like chemotaxis protein